MQARPSDVIYHHGVCCIPSALKAFYLLLTRQNIFEQKTHPSPQPATHQQKNSSASRPQNHPELVGSWPAFAWGRSHPCWARYMPSPSNPRRSCPPAFLGRNPSSDGPHYPHASCETQPTKPSQTDQASQPTHPVAMWAFLVTSVSSQVSILHAIVWIRFVEEQLGAELDALAMLPVEVTGVEQGPHQASEGHSATDPSSKDP